MLLSCWKQHALLLSDGISIFTQARATPCSPEMPLHWAVSVILEEGCITWLLFKTNAPIPLFFASYLVHCYVKQEQPPPQVGQWPSTLQQCAGSSCEGWYSYNKIGASLTALTCCCLLLWSKLVFRANTSQRIKKFQIYFTCCCCAHD